MQHSKVNKMCMRRRAVPSRAVQFYNRETLKTFYWCEVVVFLLFRLGPFTGNLKHLPFFSLGETWETYEPRFEEALTWLTVSAPYRLTS